MRVVCYCRVSTENQSLDRQLESTTEYAQREFDVGLGEIDVLTDKSTGTNTKRTGYSKMMKKVEAGNIDAVVVHSVSRLARSIRDLDQTAKEIESHGTDVHIVSEGIKILSDDTDPYQTALLQLLGVFAELEAEMIRQRVTEGIRIRQQNEDYHHGPAPLGFEKNDGYLIEADGYDRVRTVLELVDVGELSKRKAAKELDTSRRTINRALDRPELYNL